MRSVIPSLKKTSLLAMATLGAVFAPTAWGADYPGWVKVENFDNITGGIAGLRSSAKFTNNQPDSVTFVSSLYYSRTPGADNYGSRISGFITPTETADYVFFVAADDNTSLYLSTDSSPANLKLVAADQGWQNSRTWVGPGGASSGAGTVDVVFRRGYDPGDAVLQQNNFEWVGPFENRSDQFLNSPRTNLLGAAPDVPWPQKDANGNAVIHLNANQKYYFELLYTEGTGGENTGVAWKKATDPDPVNGDPEIPGDVLSVDYGTSLTFFTQPQSQTVNQNQPVTFTVFVVGVPGDSDQTQFTYQWLVNGQPVVDQPNGPSYTILAPTVADSGKKFSVKVTTVGGLTATSAEATLTVVDDVVPPVISKVGGSETLASIKVTFSEAVRDEAANPANYTLSGGVTVTDANFAIVVNPDPANPENPKSPQNPSNRVAVILFTSKQTAGATYDLTVNNVRDITGNALAPNTAKFYANTFRAGVLNYKRWEWPNGNNIANLLADPIRLANPTVVGTRTTAETGGYVAGTYVDRLDGYFIPTVTTNYVFLMSADNDGYLYLSTDSEPANKKMIAADVGWQNTREWTGPGGDTAKRRGDGAGGGPFENRSDELLTSQRAINGTGFLAGLLPADGADPDPWPNVDGNGNAVITLTAGQRYYFELWHVEGDSGRAEATMKHAGAPDPANGTASAIVASMIGALIDPLSLPPTITTQPANVNFTVGGPINFSVVADSAMPLTYQWYRNQLAIAGATNSTLSIPSATLADIGSYYVAVANVNGTLNSATAAALTAVTAPGLAFQQDGTGMTVIEAEHYFAASESQSPAGHFWVPVTGRAGYSGSGFMAALPDSGRANSAANVLTNGPKLDFKIVFNAPGTNYIWLRGSDPFGGGAGDSVHAGLNGVIPASATRIDGTPSFNIATGWNWVSNLQGDTSRAFVEVPSAGEHTFSLYMREDGFQVDKLILTTDAAYTPTDQGPPESQQAGSGRPTISVTRNASGGLVINYTGTLVSSPTANGTYTPVAGASGGTHTVNPTEAAQFYRARQ